MSRFILSLIIAPLLALAVPTASHAEPGDPVAMATKIDINSAQRILIMNCHTWHRSLNVWINSGAGFQLHGSQPPNFDDGRCPAGSPYVLDLPLDTVYEIRFTDPDPENMFCKVDDPYDSACIRAIAEAVQGGQGGVKATTVN